MFNEMWNVQKLQQGTVKSLAKIRKIIDALNMHLISYHDSGMDLVPGHNYSQKGWGVFFCFFLLLLRLSILIFTNTIKGDKLS